LYLNVVRPSGYENTTLPVAIWNSWLVSFLEYQRKLTDIQVADSFDGGAPDLRYNLSFIVQNSVNIGKPIIAASIAYRLGPFGFLNGNDVAIAGVANLGLKRPEASTSLDSREHCWLWRYVITLFKISCWTCKLTEIGDPSKVTILG